MWGRIAGIRAQDHGTCQKNWSSQQAQMRGKLPVFYLFGHPGRFYSPGDTQEEFLGRQEIEKVGRLQSPISVRGSAVRAVEGKLSLCRVGLEFFDELAVFVWGEPKKLVFADRLLERLTLGLTHLIDADDSLKNGGNLADSEAILARILGVVTDIRGDDGEAFDNDRIFPVMRSA